MRPYNMYIVTYVYIYIYIVSNFTLVLGVAKCSFDTCFAG